MKRLPLLEALRLAAPALGDDDPLPALAHFCFDDDSFYAYNDIVAVIVSMKTGLSLGLHGQTLLGVLGASRSEDIEFKQIRGEHGVSIKGSNVKLPTIPKKDFVFNIPAEEPVLSITLTDDIKAAIQICLLSVAEDSMRPEYNGVTLRIGKTGTMLYSTDNVTATRVAPPSAKVPARKETAVVLPKAAADLILKLFGDGMKPKMTIGEKIALVDFGGEPNVLLMTKLLGQPSMKLADVFDAHAGQGKWCARPEGLVDEIEKSRVLSARDALKECVLIAKDGKLIVKTDATLGSQHAELEIADKKMIVSVGVNPELVARILPHVGSFHINDNASLVFGGGVGMSTTHIISAIPKAQQAPEAPPATSRPAAAAKPPAHKFDDLEDDIPF